MTDRTRAAAALGIGILLVFPGCGLNYTMRNLKGGGGLMVDSVGIVGFDMGDLLGASYSTTGNVSLEHKMVLNIGSTGFDTGDIFVDEAKYLFCVFTMQGKARPYVGAGALFGIYVEDDGTAEGETDFGVGLSVAAGLEAKLAEGFSLGLEYSYNLNSVPEYGGGDLTLSLIFKK